MQTIKLDVSQKNNVPLLYVKQRDVGHKFAIELYENGTPYTVDEENTFAVWYSGASGDGNYTEIGDEAAIFVDRNHIEVQMIMQMLNEPGDHEMCVVMYGQDNEQNGFWNIPYFVEPIPGADSKPAIAYYQAFLKAQENAEKAAQEAKDAAKVAAENAVAAVVQEIDVSKAGDGSVMLRLYSSGGCYDASVTGTGAIKDYTPDNRPYDAGKICTLHIGDGITGIGAYFMYGALNLKELTFGANCKITKLNDSAFRSSGITEASFPYLTEMGNTVFNSCTSLVSADLGGNITTLPLGSFSNCLELEKITGLGNVKTIEIGVFRLTPKLAELDFNSAKLTEVKALAFYASGFEYDWDSLPNCAFGSFAIPTQLNEDAPWEGLIITEKENPLPTLFDQNYSKWADENIGTSDTPYMDGCVLFSFIHAYCGLTGQHMDAPTDLTGDVLNGYDSDIDYTPTLADAFELGAVKYDEFNAESLQALYDALAEGRYAVLRLGGRNIDPITDENPDNDWRSLGGHVVMVYGVRRDGKLLIADSSITRGEGKGCTYALHPKAFIPSASVYNAESAFTYILEKEKDMKATLIKGIDYNSVSKLTGTFTPDEETSAISLDIPAGAKVVEIAPSSTPSATQDRVATLDDGSKQYVIDKAPVHLATYAQVFQKGKDTDPIVAQIELYMRLYKKYSRITASVDTSSGFSLTANESYVFFEKDMTYNWTAYYWNEEE